MIAPNHERSQSVRLVDDAPATPPTRARFRFLTDTDVENQPPIGWQWDGIIPAGSFGEIHAQPGGGKSFLALAIALCSGTGRSLFGRAMKRGPVIYVAAEGSAGLGPRVSAWKHSEESYERANVHFATEPVELLDTDSVGQFLAAIDALHLPQAPVLIVLDTLARCLIGGEENSARDVGLAINGIDCIRRETGAAVLVIHHTRKDGESERGSTALRGACDVMISLKRDGDRLTMTCDKQKDAPPFQPIELELVPTKDSCVLITAETSLAVTDILRMPDALLALRSLHDAAPLDEGLSTSRWLGVSGLKERTFYERRKALLIGGYVEYPKRHRGAPNLVTPRGREAITANCNIAA